MRNKKIYDLTFTAIFAAMIAIMSFVPFLGFIPNPIIPGASLTIIHIVVIIGGIVQGRKASIALGTFFGVMSLLIAIIRPSGPLDQIFLNPLISVLPRVVFGIVIYEIYDLMNKFTKKSIISISVTMFVSTIIHTIAVVTMLYVFGKHSILVETFGDENTRNFLIFFSSVFLLTGVLEAVLAVLIGGPVTLAIFDFQKEERIY